MITKPTNTEECIEVSYITNTVLLPHFSHSCGHPQGDSLQRVDISQYYKSFWTNANI